MITFIFFALNAQNKKEQIENLTYSLDSLTKFAQQEREEFNEQLDRNIDEIFNLKNSKSKISELNQELFLKLTAKDRAVDSLEEINTTQVIIIDSISRALDSMMQVVSQSEGVWSSIRWKNTYYNHKSDNERLRYILTEILFHRVNYLMSYTGTSSEIRTRNIKELSIYRTQDNFKALVDYIYHLGFVICMGEGDYYVKQECNFFE